MTHRHLAIDKDYDGAGYWLFGTSGHSQAYNLQCSYPIIFSTRLDSDKKISNTEPWHVLDLYSSSQSIKSGYFTGLHNKILTCSEVHSSLGSTTDMCILLSFQMQYTTGSSSDIGGYLFVVSLDDSSSYKAFKVTYYSDGLGSVH